MSDAIEVLKETIEDYELLVLTAGINNKKKLYDADVKRIDALKEALLALEKQEKLKEWLEKEIEKEIVYSKQAFAISKTNPNYYISNARIRTLREVKEVLERVGEKE